MADAQAGRAILELGAEGNRCTSQARLSWMIPACHHSRISIPSTLTRGEGKKRKRRPSSWDPWRALGPGWLAGWLAGWSARWPGHGRAAASLQVARCKLQLGGPLPMRPCPHPPCPRPLPLPPHCWRGHGDSLTLLQIGLVHFVRLLAAGAAGAGAAAAGGTAQSHKVTAGEGADSLTGLVWYGLPCTKLGANLSLSLRSSCFACPATLQPPFCCSALPSRPIRDIQDSPGLIHRRLVAWARLAVVCRPRAHS